MLNVCEEIETAHLKAKTDWHEVIRLRDLATRIGRERDIWKDIGHKNASKYFCQFMDAKAIGDKLATLLREIIKFNENKSPGKNRKLSLIKMRELVGEWERVK